MVPDIGHLPALDRPNEPRADLYAVDAAPPEPLWSAWQVYHFKGGAAVTEPEPVEPRWSTHLAPLLIRLRGRRE